MKAKIIIFFKWFWIAGILALFVFLGDYVWDKFQSIAFIGFFIMFFAIGLLGLIGLWNVIKGWLFKD